MNKVVLITGASGYIGRNLKRILQSKGYTVHTFTTQELKSKAKDTFYWNPSLNYLEMDAFKDVEYIIHLAGAGIGQGKWTEKSKSEIISSRTLSTRLLLETVLMWQFPLKAFISASATGFYGSEISEELFDENYPCGSDFPAKVCNLWEAEAGKFAKNGFRTAIIRTGVVMGKESTALKKMILPVKLGIGSPLGSGKQFVPWISLTDICGIYLKALEDDTMEGIYNAVSPVNLTNKTLMKQLAKKLRKPFIFPAIPEFLLKLFLGEMSVIVTRGNRISAKKIQDAGYKFQHPDFKSFLESADFQ